MGKAYHAGRNRIGEYELEWLEVPEETTPVKKVPRTDAGKLKVKIKERMDKFGKEESLPGKTSLKCIYCGIPLGRRDKSDYIAISRLNDDGKLEDFRTFDSMYEVSKDTGIS